MRAQLPAIYTFSDEADSSGLPVSVIPIIYFESMFRAHCDTTLCWQTTIVKCAKMKQACQVQASKSVKEPEICPGHCKPVWLAIGRVSRQDSAGIKLDPSSIKKQGSHRV